MVTLCFDFGNTRLKYAVFKERELQFVEVLDDAEPDTITRLLQKVRPKKSILSSVINHNIEIEKILSAHSRFHLLSNLTKLPFTAPVTKPETIGADRLALSAGAVSFFPGKHNLVIGLGTCITYNFISKYNQFLGGAISPGMEMRLKSLKDYTAKSPPVKSTLKLLYRSEYASIMPSISFAIPSITPLVILVFVSYPTSGKFQSAFTRGNLAV